LGRIPFPEISVLSMIETAKRQGFTPAVMPIAITGAIALGRTRARQGKPCFAGLVFEEKGNEN
jgi:hypothetical protein